MSRTFSPKRLFAWHSWIGIHLGVLLLAICVSGTVAVFTPEIDEWLDPALTVEPPPAGAPKVGMGAVIRAVRQAHPLAEVTFGRREPGPHQTDVVSISYGRADSRTVHVDPYRATIVGERTGLTLKSFVRIFHKQLFLVSATVGFHGTLLVGLFALALLVAGLSGLCAFPDRWRALYRLRLHHGRRTLYSDLHRLAGSWSLIVACLLALTGIWYLGEQVGMSLDLVEHEPIAELEAPDHAGLGDRLRLLPVDDLIERAEALYPELEVRAVELPSRPGQAIGFRGPAEAVLVRDAANEIALDPFTGSVVTLRKGSARSVLDRLNHTMDPLHFGTFGGLTTRLLFLVSGLAICAGIVLGTVLYTRRMRSKARHQPFKRSLWSWSGALSSVALFVAALSGAGYLLIPTLRRPDGPQAVEAVGATHLAGCPVQLFRSAGRPDRGTLHVRFETDAIPNCTALQLATGDGEDAIALRLGLQGARGAATPELLAAAPASIRLVATTVGGHQLIAPFRPVAAEERVISAPPTIPTATRVGIALFSLLILLSAGIWLWHVRVPRRGNKAPLALGDESRSVLPSWRGALPRARASE
ncbi:MAG: PepSY domain-containing protein [Planctomycetota bacterium]